MEQQPVQLHMEQFTFKLADFEGPLDLLLYLVSKNKMSLADIEIVKLIDQYVSIVHGVRAEEMESASEFIEMAARLVQMKSFFLLPKSEEAERMKKSSPACWWNTACAKRWPPGCAPWARASTLPCARP